MRQLFIHCEELDTSCFEIAPDFESTLGTRVRGAIKHYRKNEIAKLPFAVDCLDCWPDRANEELSFVSTNDKGLKRVGVHVVSVGSFEIDCLEAKPVFTARDFSLLSVI